MTSNKHFHFEITSSELRWLAEVLGYVKFPLFNIPNKNESEMDLVGELKIAQSKIQERGLAAPLPGSGWQVERLVVALMQVIANPDLVQVLQIWHKDGTYRRTLIYPNNDLPLLVEVSDVLQFTIHSDLHELNTQKQDFSNLPPKFAVAQTSFQFPMPGQPHSLAWNSSEEFSISNLMDTLGSDGWEDLLGQMTTMGVITDLGSTEDGFEIRDQKSLFWNRKNIWGGSVMASGVLNFPPLSHAQALALLGS
jgi:hypothetical protein